ncbi:MAG: hypothetical protein NVS2B16_28020 [Chloroflexota bacterium]
MDGSANDREPRPGVDISAGGDSSGENMCPDCGGTGHVSNGQECANCDGTGFVTEAVGGG